MIKKYPTAAFSRFLKLLKANILLKIVQTTNTLLKPNPCVALSVQILLFFFLNGIDIII